MSPVRDDFDSPQFQSRSPYSFKLGGRDWHTRGDVPWNLLQKTADFGGDGQFTVPEFFGAVIVPGEVDDFMEMISKPGSPLHSGNIGPLMERIFEALTKRPTSRAERRSPGSRTAAKKSGGASRSQGGRRTTSAA